MDTPINTLLLVFIAVLLLVIGFFLREAMTMKQGEVGDQLPASTSPPIIVNVPRGGDDRYTMAPQPLRRWDMITPRVLDPIPTRGYPDEYQSMGVIKGADGKVLPLYGRRTAPRSDRFNYYTRTDTYNPVPLPVTFKKRDCQDQVGCEELSDGDNIRIQGTDDAATVKLYRFDVPIY